MGVSDDVCSWSTIGRCVLIVTGRGNDNIGDHAQHQHRVKVNSGSAGKQKVFKRACFVLSSLPDALELDIWISGYLILPPLPYLSSFLAIVSIDFHLC